jgi:eukaryotic-like serine/threonine-protein kinase
VTDGQVLAGRYEIGAVLGRGGMAEVRAAWDLRLGRAVAVKTLLPGLAEQPTIRQRFDGEARAAARLAHPNAVAIFDVGEERGVPFLVMEQVVGPTLEEEMRGGPLDAGRLRRLGEELLGALGAAHSAGLVHRDVKPANVLMAPDGSAKLGDFGIAKAVVDEEDPGLQVDHTTTGQIVGTVAYMAPERLAGRPATVQSDIYSVGVVLYEGLTGTRPFAAPTPIAMVHAIDQASPAPLRDCCPGLDPALVATVERAMAKNPEERFASAAAMSAALRAGAEPPGDVTDTPTVMAMPTALTAVVPDSAALPGQRAGHGWAGRLARRRILALATVAGLAVALIAVAVAIGGDDPKILPGGTPAVTAPPPTVLSPPPSEDRTSTSTATTRTDGQRGKGKGKDNDDDNGKD